MAVRKHPKKEGFWIIEFRPAGRHSKQSRIPFRGTLAEAQLWEAEIRRSHRGSQSANLYPQLIEAAPDFLASYKLDHQPRGTERTILSLKHILAYFGRYQFTAINNIMVEGYKQHRLGKGVTMSTINKELAALSSLMKWAAGRGYCPEFRVKRFPPKLTKAPLPDVPPREEVLLVLSAIPWPLQGFYLCLYWGGLRSSEARGLTVESVYRERGVLIVRGKGNKQRVVPIVPPLAEAIDKRLKEVKTGQLWPVPGTTTYWLKEAARRVGVARNYYPHLLRHAFGCHAAAASVNLRALQTIMGHSTVGVTEIYTQLAANSLISELDKFAGSHREEMKEDKKAMK